MHYFLGCPPPHPNPIQTIYISVSSTSHIIMISFVVITSIRTRSHPNLVSLTHTRTWKKKDANVATRYTFMQPRIYTEITQPVKINIIIFYGNVNEEIYNNFFFPPRLGRNSRDYLHNNLQQQQTTTTEWAVAELCGIRKNVRKTYLNFCSFINVSQKFGRGYAEFSFEFAQIAVVFAD